MPIEQSLPQEALKRPPEETLDKKLQNINKKLTPEERKALQQFIKLKKDEVIKDLFKIPKNYNGKAEEYIDKSLNKLKERWGKMYNKGMMDEDE